MTLHVILPTSDGQGLAWVTDDLGYFGLGNTSRTNKIEYLDDKKVAFGAWGDFIAASVGDEFMKRAANGSVDLADRPSVVHLLQEIGERKLAELPPQMRHRRDQEQCGHGVIVATFDESVHLFQAFIGGTPLAREMAGEVTAGDLYNPARAFPRYYYPQSGKSLKECAALGVHTLRLAKVLNSNVIGDLEVWLYESGHFRRLTPAELSPYIQTSEALDFGFLEQIKQVAL
jgi:hypothetical protein